MPHELLFGSDAPTMHMPDVLARGMIGFHSGWRYIILLLLLAGIITGWQTSKGKKPFTGFTKRMGMFTMIAVDIQLIVGLVLYFFLLARYTDMHMGKLTDQMRMPEFRSIAVDHLIGMLIAIILIHIGYSKAKKATVDAVAGKKQFGYFLAALIIILLSIPWPFMSIHAWRGWF